MIFGPPGSGKGTQANLAAGKLNLIHFDTGRYLREYLYDLANKNNKMVKSERQLNEAGELNTSAFTARIVINEVTKIAKAGYGVVFSGSPRTLYEAEKLLPILSRLYGRNKLTLVELRVHPNTSLKRNSNRILCNFCELTILKTLLPHPNHLKICPFCGSKFKKRTDDNPKIINVRLKEYNERTKPIFNFLKTIGFRVREINGEPTPHKVSTQVLKAVGYSVNNSRKKR